MNNNDKGAATLQSEISELLENPLRSSLRVSGPTFFSDTTNLTYYIVFRKSGSHNLLIGRSKNVYGELKEFLESYEYDVDQHSHGHARILGITSEQIVETINLIEASFKNSD